MKTWALRISVGVVAVAIVLTAFLASRHDSATEPTIRRELVGELPVQVAIEPSAAHYAEAVRDAMKSLNDEAPCTLVKEGARGDVVVIGATGTPCGGNTPDADDKEASTYYCTTGRRMIQVRSVPEYARAVTVLRHEIVHALGHVEHDDRGSLMAPGAPTWMLTDKDRNSLRALCEVRR